MSRGAGMIFLYSVYITLIFFSELLNVMIFPTLFLSYIIIYLHFFSLYWFYSYMITHPQYAYSGAYSCIAHVLIHVLIHAQPYCTVYKDRVDTIIL